MHQKSSQHDLLTGNLWTTLISFAVPFMLSTLLQTLYNTVDTIVVGQFVGSAGISAVSFTGTLVNLSITLCTGLATAGQICIAQYIGAERKNEIKKVIASMTVMIAIMAVIVSVVVIVFLDPILRLLSTPDEAFQMAREYMIICACGIIFTAFYNMMSAIFRGMGDSRHPFIFILIASVVNIVLDLLFTGLFKWGVAGAALATIIGQAVSVVYSFVFLLKHRAEFYCDFKKGEFKVEGTVVSLLARLGVPLMISGSAINISLLFVAKFVNQLGVTVSAALGVGQKLSQIPTILTNAIGQATTAIIGQNFGAGRYDRVRKIVWISLLFCTIVQLVFCGLCTLFPHVAFGLFTTEASVHEYAFMWCFATLVGFLAFAGLPPVVSLMQGIGDSKVSLIIAMLDAFVGRVAFTYLLGIVFDLGALGFFMGYTCGAYFSTIPGLIYFLFVKWEKRGLAGMERKKA